MTKIKKYQREALASIYQEWEQLGEDESMAAMIITLDVLGYTILRHRGQFTLARREGSHG